MKRESIYTAIDLGTSKICTIVARVGHDGQLQVLGLGVVPSQGILKGMLANPQECRDALAASLEQAQRYLGRRISWAYVGVTGNFITSRNRVGSLQGVGELSTVASRQVHTLSQPSYDPEVEPGKEVLHVIPRGYTVDGLKGVRNPSELLADHLEVESHVILADAPPLRNVLQAVQQCGVAVHSLVLEPLAASEAVLGEDEREMGVVLADIGGGTTDVAIFENGHLSHTAIIPVGGHNLTRDLSFGLDIPYALAEEAKVKWGCALPQAVDEREKVMLSSFQRASREPLGRRALCRVLHIRLEEIIKLICLQAPSVERMRFPLGGLVLTGGSAALPGIDELARELVPGIRVRIGYPQGIGGLPAELKQPAFSTSMGILLWGIKHHGERKAYGSSNGDSKHRGYKALLRRLKWPFLTHSNGQ
ncbi:MAG: cell division protein FtsA [Dehalococcoidia bacterium]